MIIKLEPVNDNNREAVLALSVREDQPFVAPNDYSLNEAEETNKEHPGTARPFAICADDRLVGFCMFAFGTNRAKAMARPPCRRSLSILKKTVPTGSSCPPGRRTRLACTSITKPASGRPELLIAARLC